ncbi:protein phosphatase 2C domain-containing protein [Candidatus Margulisiibacteriota bacterium]
MAKMATKFNLTSFAAKPGRLPRFLTHLATNGIARAKWQGTLQTINRNVLVPITTEQFAVAPELKTQALMAQMKLNRALLKLPTAKPAPKAPEKTPEKTQDVYLPELDHVSEDGIWGGAEGKILGEKIGIAGLFALSVVGARKNNEDGVIARRRDGKIFLAIFDGMGGMDKGEVASAIASEKALECFTKEDPRSFDISVALVNGHEAIKEQKIAGGTTAVAVLIEGSEAETGNIGDSRAFVIRFRNGLAELRLLSPEDSANHDYYMENMRQKAGNSSLRLSFPLSPEETAAYHDGVADFGLPNIKLALGKEPTKEEIEKGFVSPFPMSTRRIALEKNDLLLLASDGLTDFLSFAELKSIVEANQNKSPEVISQALHDAAFKNMQAKMAANDQVPGDNITIMIYRHGSRSAQAKEQLAKDLSTAFKIELPDAEKLIKHADENAVLGERLEMAVNEIIEKQRAIGKLETRQAELEQQLRGASVGQLEEDGQQAVQELVKLQIELKGVQGAVQTYSRSIANHKERLQIFTRQLQADQKHYNERLAAIQAEYEARTKGPQIKKMEDGIERKRADLERREKHLQIESAKDVSQLTWEAALEHTAWIGQLREDLAALERELKEDEADYTTSLQRLEKAYETDKNALLEKMNQDLDLANAKARANSRKEIIAQLESDIEVARHREADLSAALRMVRPNLEKILHEEISPAIERLTKLAAEIREKI